MVKGFRADDSAARCESRSLPESFIKASSNLVRRGLFACAEVGVGSCAVLLQFLYEVLGERASDRADFTPFGERPSAPVNGESAAIIEQ